MRILTFCFFNLVLLLNCNVSVHAADNPSSLIKAMQAGGHILMIRHANAPGFGDPDNFKISDCSTQRNLDEEGRIQSIKIGEWLQSHEIKISAIYSSQWCRCLETARLLDLGSVNVFPPLNSFYQKPQNREPSLKNLKQFIVEQTPENDLIIMITHHVTIGAISGKNVAPGNGVLLKLKPSAPYEFVSVVTTGRVD